MSKNASITCRVAAQTKSDLQTLAELTDRKAAWHVERALEEYLAREQWQIEGIHAGIESLEARRSIDHEQVKELMAKRLSARPAR